MKIPFFRRVKKQRLPLVSVITATFNAAETLEETIASVVGQRYGNIEFILVDGQSADGTALIIRNAARRHRMIRWVSETDNGAYDAMNKGLAMSRGDWVYFLGSDDVLFSNRIFLELFEEGYFSQEKVFYGNVIIDGETAWAKDGEVYAEEFTLPMFLKRNICHQSIFYPRPIVNKAGFFNTDYVVCSDWDYNMRCYAMQPFLYVNKIIARFRAGGLSSVKKETVFSKEFPGNIIRYFGLDPDDPKLVEPESVFRSVALTYRKLKAGG